MDPADQVTKDRDRLTRYCLHIAKQKRRIRVTSNSAACLIVVEERSGADWKPIRTINRQTATEAIAELVGKMRYDSEKKAFV